MTIKSSKRGALVSNLVDGIGALIIMVVIVLVVVSTILGANLLRSTATTTTATDTNAWINSTTYTLDNFDSANREYTITSIVNASNGVVIAVGNYTFTAATGIITNATATTWGDVNITYTYITPTDYESTTSSLGGNFTSGIDNVSTKIPTILLIAIIIVLLGVMIILLMQAKKSGLMGSGSGSL